MVNLPAFNRSDAFLLPEVKLKALMSHVTTRKLRGADASGGLLSGEDAVGWADRARLPAGVLRLQRLELPQLCDRGGGRTQTVNIHTSHHRGFAFTNYWERSEDM